ncbi:hypothetical protein diail_11416 [Diaporthe ilicicola]|nr:hypothetical protein diail_11416 [Diaporthe ilicicola]
MADRTLGKLLRKSRSLRRGRGSVDAGADADRDADSSSIGSDSATLSLSRGRSRRSSVRRSHTSEVLGDSQTEDGKPSVVIHVPADKEAEEEDPSLGSYDSEDPGLSVTTRPAAISNHPSQIGYLTTNSPLIQSEYYQQGSQPSQDSVTTDRLGDSDPSGSPITVGLAPPGSQSSSRRSPSPVGRLKGVFRSKKSFSKLSGGGSGASSPERRPSTAGARLSSDLTDAPKLLDRSKTDLTTDSDSDLKNAVVEEKTEQQIRGSAERSRRLSKGQTIVTSTPPGTPGASEKGTPVIVNTPPTPTDSSKPKLHKPQSPQQTTGSAEDITLGQRRGRSGSASLVPSKLSTIYSAPLTPTPENGIPTPANPASGFFGSVLSAAQNAANTLTSTIQNTNISPGVTKNRGVNSTQSLQNIPVDDDKVEVEPSVEASAGKAMESHEPAIKTLGTGDLSLSHLGIEPTARSTTPTKPNFPEQIDVNRSRSESAPAEATPVKISGEVPWDDSQRPQSVYHGSEPPSHGDKTPPPGSLNEESTGIHRSGSIRSAIGRHNRKRGSTNGTGGTGNTIGAALASANAALSQPGSLSNAPKLTGFAVASKKRNRDFHALFKSVPDDDYLIEDYSCALQREILAHGRLYVSEGHLCFSSNILGWVTTLVMSFDEIVSVEKRSTALLFKNGLMISTLHAKHIFASFTSRDSTYDLIVKIWKLGHPELQSSLNGVRLDETGGDKTEKVDAQSIIGGDQSASVSADEDGDEEEDESDDGEDVYDEDEDDDDVPAPSQTADPPLLESALEKSVSRKPSGAVTASLPNDKPKDAPAGAPSQDFPGPATHAPTDCGDADAHYKKVVGDDVIPAPLGKVYDLMFGPTAVTWMSKWLTVDQKCTDLQSEDKKGLTLDNRTRNYTYIKPLSGSIGPKQTKCIVSEHLESLDLDKSVNVLCTTQNPDVPSGNIFSVKTKYCLSWAENNATRVQINCIVEWTGKSWLKGPIENGANEGQTQYCKDLFSSLKAAVSSKARQPLAAGAGKGKKKGKKGKAAAVSNVTSDTEETTKTSSKQDWGMFEPLHGILGPVVDIGKPILTGNVVYGLLVGLLVAAWFGFGFNPRPVARPYGSELGFYGYPDRLAAYEEMWRREESELWEWLEERVGMDRLNSGEIHTRKKVVEPRTMAEKLREDRMDESEVKEAIRITEEKLEVLKSVVGKKN